MNPFPGIVPAPRSRGNRGAFRGCGLHLAWCLKQSSESPWPLAQRGLESKGSASNAGWATGQNVVQSDQVALAMLWDRGKWGLAAPLGCSSEKLLSVF